MLSHGKIVGSTNKLTPAEKTVLNDLSKKHEVIEIIPRDPHCQQKSPDFKVDGVKTELKSLEHANSNTGMKRIQNAFKQGAEVVIIDARNSGTTSALAEEIINKALGKYPNRQFPGKVEIWIDEGIIRR